MRNLGIAAVASSLALSGCVIDAADYAPPTAPISANPVPVRIDGDIRDCVGRAGPVVEQRALSLPALGTEAQVDVGQALLSSVVQDLRQSDLIVLEPFAIKGRYAFSDSVLTVNPGTIPGLYAGATFAFTPTDYDFTYDDGKRISNGRPTAALYLTPQGLLGATVSTGLSAPSYVLVDAPVEIGVCADAARGEFRRELIYTGTSGGAVNLEYREYSDNLARPAFTQAVSYEIGDDPVIGFRGARVEVLTASNTSIRYRVLAPLP